MVHQHEAATKDTLNFLITSLSIDGPWSDPVFINSSGFDPSLFHDDDGKKYWLNMVWDHRPEKHPFYGIVLQEYNPKAQSLVGKSKLIFKGSTLGLTEGPHLYKRNGFYYLLTAEGGTEYEHAVSLARSKEIAGPYEIHPQNPILTSSGKPELKLQKAGHASLIETKENQWYMTHLADAPFLEPINVISEGKLRFKKWNGVTMTGSTSTTVEISLMSRCNHHPLSHAHGMNCQTPPF